MITKKQVNKKEILSKSTRNRALLQLIERKNNPKVENNGENNVTDVVYETKKKKRNNKQ